ncbi:hypothetical protein [Candidatus Enterovibrio escicola]
MTTTNIDIRKSVSDTADNLWDYSIRDRRAYI